MFRALYEVGGLRALDEECSRILGLPPPDRTPRPTPRRLRHHATARPARRHAETLRRNRAAMLNEWIAEAFDARRTRVIRVQPPEPESPPVVVRPPRVPDDPARVQARRESIEQAFVAVSEQRAEREGLWSMVRESGRG